MISDEKKYQYESHYMISLAGYNFVIRPEEREGFLKRLQEDSSLETTLSSNVNDDLWASMEYAIRMQSNSIIKAFGIPESGKSTILQIVGYHLFQMIFETGTRPKLSFTFDYPDTIHQIQQHFKDRKDGEILIIIQDEQNSLSGSESRSYQTQIDNLLKTFRAAQVFVLLASPDDVELSVCNLKIEAIAKDPVQRVNWALAYVPQRKKRRIDFVPSGTLVLEYTSEIEEFYQDFKYDDRKIEYIEKLIANRGLQTVRIPDAVLEEGIEKILKEAEKYELKTKEQVKSLANVLGIGTTNTTKTIAELAALRWEAIIEQKKEQDQLLLLEEERKRIEQEKKRISALVVDVAKELYREFDFIHDKKAFARLTKGYIIEKYPGDWQELIRHHSHMFALANYWQDKSSISKIRSEGQIDSKFERTSSDRELLRIALEKSILIRYSDTLLASRAPFRLIPDEEYEETDWNIRKAAESLSKSLKKKIPYGTFRKYLGDRKKEMKEIERNTKIWGDAGEFYFAERIRKVVKKGKKEGWIEPGVSIDLLVAAELRSDDRKTDLHDIEVVVDGVSAAAVNVKFTYVEGQSFRLVPEGTHENPWLFVLDKSGYSERIVKCEKGEEHVYLKSGGDRSVSVEDFVQSLL